MKAPSTEIELEAWMKVNCFNFHNYSINGNLIHEGFGIERSEDLFIWYFTERGERSKIKVFETEGQIIEHAFSEINNDKWARTHCIGFTPDKDASTELANELYRLGFKYVQDKIPYFGLDGPIFRTFVFGCDIEPTEHLKSKYYVEFQG